MQRLLVCSVIALVWLAAGVAGQNRPESALPGPPRPTPSQQSRDGDAAPDPSRVAGRVVRADTGAPLRDARIVISGGSVFRGATADDQGRYAIGGLPAGRYFLQASHPGYVATTYGQRDAFGTGRPIVLSDGQVVNDVDVALSRGGVIAGRITDDLGEPVLGAEIRVERHEYGPGGRRLATFPLGIALSPFQMTTNDLGEYRIFGLMSGEYVVSARIRQGRPGGSVTATGSSPDDAEGYLPTYYPGTENVAEAQAVRVGAGQEVSAHFSVVPGRMVQVSGRATNSIGRPAAGMEVRLVVQTATSSGATARTLVGSDGRFSIGNVAPGDYLIEVQPRPAGPDAEMASLHVSIGTEDLTGLQLVTRPGTTIRGVLEWEGGSPRPQRLRVSTTSATWPRRGPTGDSTFTYLDLENGTVNEDQTFEIGGAIGAVQLRILPLPQPWSIKAVLAGGRDITDSGADATELGGETRVRIILTDRATEVSGSARDVRGQPVTDYVAVLLPEQEMQGGTGIRYTRAVRADQSGRFTQGGLPPGRYVAAAVSSLEAGGEWNPDLQRKIRSSGTPFSLAEGQALTVDLELIP